MDRILVTGASGLFGGAIARQLVAMAVPIRIMVRDASRAPQLDGSAEVAVADFSDPETLDAALSDIDRVFLASYDDPAIMEHQANILAAAKHNGVRQVVRLSSNGIAVYKSLPIFYWHHLCERQVEDSGMAYTHLRPMWVMQNFESFVVNDEIRLPAGEGRIGLVDHRDVAAVGVKALTEAGHEGKAHLLASESLSHAEVAAQLSQATGRAITYTDISPDTYQQELEAAEWTQDGIDSMQRLFADVRTGINSDTNVRDTVAEILQRPGIRFSQYAQDYASRFGAKS